MTEEKSSEELLKERKERIEKVYSNKQPDRVPFSFLPSLKWVANYVRTSTADLCFNHDAFAEACIKIITDFNLDGVDLPPYPINALDLTVMLIAFIEHPDTAINMNFLTGPMHDILRDKYSKWPGRELSENAEPQFIGGKFMESEDYRKLVDNPIEFLNEVILPRAFESLSKPNSPKAYVTWMNVGVELHRRSEYLKKIMLESKELGWPSFSTVIGIRPLDYIGDHLRHVTNLLIDIFRRPDEVLRAVDVITELAIKFIRAVVPRKISSIKEEQETNIMILSYPLHLNSMLSPKLYNEFYWPSLKKVLMETINMGATPYVIFEGDHTPHLETLYELPKGKIFGLFEKTDLRKVRSVLGDHIPFAGGISSSILAFGSKGKVYTEICKLLNDVKEPGGFMFMGTDAPIPPETKTENILAAIEAVKKCGKY